MPDMHSIHAFALMLLVHLCSSTVRAQEALPRDLETAMQELSEATSRLTRLFDEHAATRAPDDVLATMRAAIPTLARSADSMPAPEVARTSIAELEAAIQSLENPSTRIRHSGRFDFAALRSACTRCHVHNRDDNERRGMFPNQGSVVHGALQLFDREGRTVADRSNLVVFLESPQDRPKPLPREPKISQRGRRFDPPVLVVTTGTTVRFPNDDVVFHNVFSLSRGNAFDLGTYGKGKTKRQKLEHPGLVKVHCNIHADMSSHVLVLNTHRAAVTDARGRWHVPDVPPGSYTVRVWHALAKGTRQKLVVDQSPRIEVPLQVREDRVRAPHPNKHGRAYKTKY